METKKETARPIVDQLKEYADTRIKLLKYEVIDLASSIAASIITNATMIVFGLITFLFASFTLALFLADVFHSYWKGFGSVALLYLLITIICVLAKKSVQTPIINILIRKLFK